MLKMFQDAKRKEVEITDVERNQSVIKLIYCFICCYD